MKNFNLITLVNGTPGVVEPLIAETQEQAIAFSSGLLTERVKGHEHLFMSPVVRFVVDTAEIDLANVTMLTGEIIGTFDLVVRGGQPKLIFQLQGSPLCSGATNQPTTNAP